MTRKKGGIDTFVDVNGISERHGIPRPTVQMWATRSVYEFPAPAMTFGRTRLWRVDDVDKWIKAWRDSHVGDGRVRQA